MSEKRKDNKGRVLKIGERQKPDGRYEYRYTDALGNKQSIYSWKLVSTDKAPAGKKCKEALRDAELRIAKDEMDGITASLGKQTVDSLCEIFVELKMGIKESTMARYIYNYNKYAKNAIGKMKAADVKYSTINKLYANLVNNKGIDPDSLSMLNSILYQIFDMAEKDNIVRSNPVNGVLTKIKRAKKKDKEKRRALTREEQKYFMKYFDEQPQAEPWKSLMIFLLGTGCRIGEAIGITWNDIDFEKNAISINHNLLYSLQNDGSHKFVITTPKTSRGIRTVPITKDVMEALMKQKERQKISGGSLSEVDGYSDFVFINSNRHVFVPTCINTFIEQIRLKANNLYGCDIKHFSVHNLRHTFCTRLYENGVDAKIIQSVMGHASINTTMDVYTDITEEAKQESFKNLDGMTI